MKTKDEPLVDIRFYTSPTRYNIQLQFLTNLHTRFDNTTDIIFQYITEKIKV